MIALFDMGQILTGTYYAIKRDFGEPSRSEFDASVSAWIDSVVQSIGGSPVLCFDGKNTWRRTVFPNYKFKRSKSDPGDRTAIASLSNGYRESTTYPVVFDDRAEADDAIAIIARLSPVPCVIVSADKDFFQLHGPMVRQYDPRSKTFLKCELTPESFLEDKIIRGDQSDSIPNVFSDDDVFVFGVRQTISSRGRIAEFRKKIAHGLSGKDKHRYDRNRTLIDFSTIPPEVESSIVSQYDPRKQA